MEVAAELLRVHHLPGIRRDGRELLAPAETHVAAVGAVTAGMEGAAELLRFTTFQVSVATVVSFSSCPPKLMWRPSGL